MAAQDEPARRLQAREEELRSAIDALRAALADGGDGTEVRDAVDEGDARADAGVDLVQLQRHEDALREVLLARGRLQRGDYGRCEACDEPIPAGRLDARPEARFCLRHEEVWEQSRAGHAAPAA